MLSIAICDDEEYFRITEKQLILKYMAGKNCECMIDMYESGKELLNLREELNQYHIIFLDVNMEEIDGIETAKEIRKITKDVFIVFVTAFITYALEGYKVDAVRYLIKDHESLEKAMTECMDTILEKMDYEENEMTFDFQEGKTTISLENILYIESNLHRLIFYMAGEDAVHYTIYTKLDDVAESLQNKGFCRIHKSYLVNATYVKAIRRYGVNLTTGNILSVSRAKYNAIQQKYTEYNRKICK